MTDKELEMLEFCVKKSGLSKADVLRLGILKIYEEMFIADYCEQTKSE